MDLLSSLAKLTGSPAPSSDSQDHLEAFLGSSNQARTSLIVEASGRTALRSGDWAMIPPHHGQEINKQVNIELGNAPDYQLYQDRKRVEEGKSVYVRIELGGRRIS